jgi:M6 family metalloprotease-like protein
VLSGFPLGQFRASTLGNVRAKVVYLDFLDYRHNSNGPSVEEQFRPLGEDVNRYFEFVSFGKMKFDWVIHPEPLLMPKNVSEYQLTRSGERPGFYPSLELVYEMLNLHRNQLDFTGAEVIVVILNQSIPTRIADLGHAHNVELDRPFVTNQGNQYNAVTMTLQAWPQHKWQLIAHELGHSLGLIDLYHFGPVDNWNDSHRYVGGFDIMGMITEDNLEFLGWNRYLMDWVDDNQVFCVDPPAESITIPIQTIGLPADSEDIQMIVIPLDRYKVLVIEAKEMNPYCKICDGLLVYTVDTTIGNGRGSIKVIPIDRSIHVFKNDAMIRVGETLIAYGFEITLQSASPDGYVVELNKVS